MFILDSEYWVLSISDPRSRIPDPGSNKQQKKIGENVLPYFFYSHKYLKIVNYFIFEVAL